MMSEIIMRLNCDFSKVQITLLYQYSLTLSSAEDEWLRLHDIRLNGPILEYIGRGKSLEDVGLAQAKSPISTRNHYFEIEVITFYFHGR